MFLASSLNKVHAQRVPIASFRITQTLRLSLRCANISGKAIVNLAQNAHSYTQCPRSLQVQQPMVVTVAVVTTVIVIIIKC